MRSRFAMPVLISAAAIALFQIVGSIGAANNQPDRRSLDALAVLLILLGPAALAVRDRWPVAAAGVAAAVADFYIARGYPYGPIFVSVAVGFFALVQTGRRQASWLVAAAGYAGYVVAAFVDPREPGSPRWLHLGLVAGWLIVVLSVSELIRTRREQHAERRRSEAEAERRRADERRLRLAQELHDVLAHNISLINVQSSVALHLLEEDPSRAAPALVAIKDASHEALRELRGALELLRGDDADHAPRTPAPRLTDIESLVAGVRRGGLDVHLDVVPPPAPLPAAVELAAYRIVQEALTNVTRHADARTVEVRIVCADAIDIEVTDDGRGGAAAPGNGLTGMAERATSVGGDVHAGPRDGGGFRVVAHLPVRAT